MEVSQLSTFHLLLSALISLVAIKIAIILYRNFTYWERHGVPRAKVGSRIGSIWTVLTRRQSFSDYSKSLYEYHPNARYIGVMDFNTPTIIIRDPKLIKELGVKNFDHFPDHRSFVTEEIDPVFGKNVFSLQGERWREMRNTLSPSFTANKMKYIFKLVFDCAYDFTDYLSNHPDQCSSLELKDAFTRYANDVIATVAFGISVNSMKDRDNEFYKSGVSATSFAGTYSLLKFMLFRLNARLMRSLGLRFLSRATSKFFRDVISDAVSVRDEHGIVRPDMIHLLMKARDTKKIVSRDMTIDDIVAQAFIFFLAGFDTVSTAMCYVVLELSLHQDVQQTLRTEVDRVFQEENGNISYESLSKMKYMDMVISETLRTNPPALFTDRVCAKQFDLPPAAPGYKSYTVHPGENVWYPAYALHHDPKYFPHPDVFDPERFNEQNKDNIDPYTYFPFGIGPRKCIGERFALMEIKILLISLLHRFSIERNPKMKIPIVNKKGQFTLAPEGGFWVTLKKRSD